MPDFTYPNIDRLLVERFAHGNGAVFVGAGVSLASQLPTWRNLVEPLREALGDEAGQRDPLQIAELYEVQHGRAALVQHLVDQLGDSKYQMNKVHELLVSLPVRRIYTTNFDDFLEAASRKRLDNRQVIYHASQVGLSDTSKLAIIKLHGDLADPSSIVITARDFYSYATRNPAVANLLQVELQTHTVLFVGYSFSDPNLSMILGNAAAQSGTTAPALYAIQFRPSDLAVDAMKARGVTVIPIDADSGTPQAQAQLETWLHDFLGHIHNVERRKLTRSVHRATCDDPPGLRTRPIRVSAVTERLLAGLSSEYPVIIVTGEEGVGKTHVVAQAARAKLLAGNRALWIDGFEQVIWIHRIARNGSYHHLGRIHRNIISQVDVGFPAEHIGAERLHIKIAGILRERRLLVVIEDLDDPRLMIAEGIDEKQQRNACKDFDEIKKWLEDIGSQAPGRSRIIVTSRTASLSGFIMEVPRLQREDAEKMIGEQARSLKVTRLITEKNASVVESIINLTKGNPQAILLSLGLINGSRKVDWLEHTGSRTDRHGPDAIRPVLRSLLEQIYDNLDNNSPALQVIETMVAFPGDEWVPAQLLGPANDPQALRTCIDYGLLDVDIDLDRYFMRRPIKEVSSSMRGFGADRLELARTQLARRLLDFLGQAHVACRPQIRARYWESLVSDDMIKVDRYWPIIENTMYWAESRPIIVRFVLLLTHYMDSRFLNELRLHFIHAAIDRLDNKDTKDEKGEKGEKGEKDDSIPVEELSHIRALLEIDALGWTYMEEGSNDEADRHIRLGVEHSPADAHELHALACIWQARICADRGDRKQARQHIDTAREHAKAYQNRPWIDMRVAMIDGDVHFLAGDINEAEQAYLQAEALEELYGGELGYQTEPRIGLALLRKTEGQSDPDKISRAIEDARQRFTRLEENQHVITGRLYGKYGLALIAARQPYNRDGLPKLQQILRDIAARQGEKNVLLKLAKEAYERLVNPREAARPSGRPGPRSEVVT